ncbi:type II toxin-antitoxin system death-on-curing family toxin [Roseivivax sp. THAF30]|uniref:type II toxin-antitoxin system death-on-curing family toxin n=1 Tax=Roseivivax sp. THAF30 TaxID=2587852 RepID=UPI001267DD76|nr:type II toxin-antitoxin system death-on-curing family toxin [Roseivivax sp. THAF30]QFT62178.1 Toxin Doc [Roseivivax sp. THAF30]
MTAPVWVPLAAVKTIHDRQISRHGGAPGLRDAGLLEGALGRPFNIHAYGNSDLFDLSAGCAFGIAKAHAFVDGNKRTAFVTSVAFLRLNGYAFRPDPVEGVRAMEDLASGALSEADFAAWLKAGAMPISETAESR